MVKTKRGRGNRVVSDQLNNLRKRLSTKAKQYEKLSKQFTGFSEKYFQSYANELKTKVEQLKVANFTTAKRGTKEYKQQMEEALSKGLSYEKGVAIYRQLPTSEAWEHVAGQQFKGAAAKQIMVATYGKLWHSNQSREQIREAITAEVRKATGIQQPSLKQVIDFYERGLKEQIREMYGNEAADKWHLATSDVDEQAMLDDSTLVMYTEKGSKIILDIQGIYSRYLGR